MQGKQLREQAIRSVENFLKKKAFHQKYFIYLPYNHRKLQIEEQGFKATLMQTVTTEQ